VATKVRQHEALQSLLLEMPGQVDTLIERRSVTGFIDFCRRAEDALKGFGFRQAADVAAARAMVEARPVSAERGPRSRKDKARRALEQSGTVQRALSDAILPAEETIAQARPLIRQIINLIAASGALRIGEAHEVADLPGRIWTLASGHEQLSPLALQARIHLDRGDILAVILAELDLADFMED